MAHTHAAYKRPISGQKTYTDWKWRGETNFPSKGRGKKSRGSNTDIRQNRLQKKGIKREPEGNFKKLKGRIHQEDINNVNIYDIDSNTIIVGNFNIPLSKMDRSSKQNIKNDIVSLNNTPQKIKK